MSMLAEIFGADGAIVAALAVVVFFGATKLPEIARSMGRAQGEFKKGLREGADPDAPAPATGDGETARNERSGTPHDPA